MNFWERLKALFDPGVYETKWMLSFNEGYDKGFQAGKREALEGLDHNDGTYKRDDKGRFESLTPITPKSTKALEINPWQDDQNDRKI